MKNAKNFMGFIKAQMRLLFEMNTPKYERNVLEVYL